MVPLAGHYESQSKYAFLPLARTCVMTALDDLYSFLWLEGCWELEVGEPVTRCLAIYIVSLSFCEAGAGSMSVLMAYSFVALLPNSFSLLKEPRANCRKVRVLE